MMKGSIYMHRNSHLIGVRLSSSALSRVWVHIRIVGYLKRVLCDSAVLSAVENSKRGSEPCSLVGAPLCMSRQQQPACICLTSGLAGETGAHLAAACWAGLELQNWAIHIHSSCAQRSFHAMCSLLPALTWTGA